MKQYIFLIITLSSVNISTAETHAALHEQKIIAHTVQDDMSPLGFWETQIEYPIFVNPLKNAALTAINNDISLMAEKYHCDENKGDKQFSAVITLLNESVVSLKFSDSWYCVGMSHSQGRTGAITYSLKTGDKIEINNEIKQGMKEEMAQKLNAGLTQALKIKQVDEECPTELGYFYSTKSDVVFVNKSDTQETVQCEVEFKVGNDEMKKYLKESSALL